MLVAPFASHYQLQYPRWLLSHSPAPHHGIRALHIERHRVELENQQLLFDEQKALLNEQLAKAVADASNQQRNFDSHMARAALEGCDMKEAFERMSHDNAVWKKAELAANKVGPPIIQNII